MIATPPPDPDQSVSEKAEDGSDRMLEEALTRSRRKDVRRVLLLAALVAVFMAIAHFTPLRAWITNVQVWKEQVRSLGILAHTTFAIGCALAVLMGVPRLPLCAAAGLIFGFAEGVALSLAGSTVGSFGAFQMARHGARKLVVARARHWPWLAKLLREPTLLKVFWVRQLMLPGMVLNVLLGVTQVRGVTFLLGTLLGYLPLNVAFSLVGSGLGKGNLAQTLVQLLAALGVVNVVGWLVWRWARQRSRSRVSKVS